ncbi:MAG: type 2 isopentenyl-diphosphate Delta-isomerase [Candidatus Tectomicrobia bacterium]|nr:type 2 isopentenyl-diphosphate Delta-isomerase [Candidatus Tectomicrobia bacterium]
MKTDRTAGPERPEARIPQGSSRKRDHVEICAGEDVQGGYHYWDDLRFVHNALPEIDLEEVDLSVTLFGKRLHAPLIISSMTGGYPEAEKINDHLAYGAAAVGVGFGVGSQRVGLERPETQQTYAVVKRHHVPLVIANLGVPQLIAQRKPALSDADVQAVMEMIKADVLALHLNFLQEVVQPEGDHRARGCLEAVARLGARWPILAKETGGGISRSVALRLKEAGVAGIDVGGQGGTSFSAVEYYRAARGNEPLLEKLGQTFWEWGIPTPVAVVESAVGLPVVATGGLRSGLDVARALSLGASAGGMAIPMLEAALLGPEAVVARLREIIAELRAAMFLLGVRRPAELQRCDVVILGATAQWLRARGYDPARFAARQE